MHDPNQWSRETCAGVSTVSGSPTTRTPVGARSGAPTGREACVRARGRGRRRRRCGSSSALRCSRGHRRGSSGTAGGTWRLSRDGVEAAAIPVQADAALLCDVFGIPRSPAALANGIGHVRAGGQVVAGGAKWVPWWRLNSFALNLYVWPSTATTSRPSGASPAVEPPCSLPELDVEEVFLGGGFITAGTASTAPGTHARTRARRRSRSAQRSQRHARLASDRTDESN